MLAGGYGFYSGTGKKFSIALKLKMAVGFIVLKSYRWDYQEEMRLDGGAYHSLLLLPK